MGILNIEMTGEAVAVVTMDDPERPVNAMGVELLAEFEEKLAPLTDDPEVSAIVLASAKKSTFIAGADIKGFNSTLDGKLISELDGAYSRVLTRLAECGKPVVAAVHGAALGGGLEVVLACHYILATNHPSTQLGLPEVQLGILPAAGGTQRLPARVGLFKGLDMMLTGKRVRANKALSLGLVDEIIEPELLVDTAIARARELAEGSFLAPRRSPTLAERLVALPGVRGVVFNQARKKVLAKTRGNYPGPLRIVDCVETGLAKGRDAALELEIRSIGELIVTPQARSLIWLFVAMNEIKEAESKSDVLPVNQMAVVGGGLMGAGIAGVSLARCPVVVRDVDQEALDRCQRVVFQGIDKQLAAGAVTPNTAEERRARLACTTDMADLAEADLVVEAVHEELGLKQTVLAQAEEVIADDAVFASCTSAIPIKAIAEHARHPERVVGMHYFSPVPKMPLLELIAPAGADPGAVARARAFGLAQGKTVITVQDTPGFYTTRILTPYLGEAARLAAEGVDIKAIDRAMKNFGFPVGPMQLMDEIGIDVTAKVSDFLQPHFQGRWDLPVDLLKNLVERGVLGKKVGQGFYSIDGQGKKSSRTPNQQAYSIIGGKSGGSVQRGDIADRLALLMVNEAAWCLDEGVVASPRDADVAAVMGLGFPPFRGGPFHHVDQVGAAEVVARLEQLAQGLGPRYQPADSLKQAAASGTKFFPDPEG